MKNKFHYLIILTILSLTSIEICAQSTGFKRHEIELNYSYFTADGMIGNFYSEFLVKMPPDDENSLFIHNHKSLGAIFLTYRYNVIKRFSVGLSCGLDITNAEIINKYKTVFGESKKIYITPAVELKFIYIDKKIVRLYGFLGVGYSFAFYKNHFNPGMPTNKVGDLIENHLNGQLTPLGIRLGKKFGGFLEIGLGYKGLLNVGISLNL